MFVLMFFKKLLAWRKAKAIKPFYSSMRRLYANRSYGFTGVNELTGSDQETDIFKDLYRQHGPRIESMLKILTELKISSTFKEEDERTKQVLRLMTIETMKFLKGCELDWIERNADKTLKNSDVETAKTQAKLSGKPLSF